MAVKKYKPTSPGTRFRISVDYSDLSKEGPEKSLLAKKSSTGGRNSKGRMTMRYRGGGHKQRYRIIDFKRNKDGIPAKVKAIEYDPNRSAHIALLFYADGEKRYIIAPQGLKVGDEIISGPKSDIEPGNAMQLKDIPVGTIIHAVEMRPGAGAAIARGAGTEAQLMGKEGKYAAVKLPSGEVRRILLTCKATIGTTSNHDHNQTIMGKAGRNRWKGRRPRTRGISMNPVDHPMGGGEGKATGGLPRSRNGIFAKGQKTRSKTNPSNRLIISKRKKRKK